MAFFKNEYVYAALNDSIKNLAAREQLQLLQGNLEQYVVFF